MFTFFTEFSGNFHGLSIQFYIFSFADGNRRPNSLYHSILSVFIKVHYNAVRARMIERFYRVEGSRSSVFAAHSIADNLVKVHVS